MIKLDTLGVLKCYDVGTCPYFLPSLELYWHTLKLELSIASACSELCIPVEYSTGCSMLDIRQFMI